MESGDTRSTSKKQDVTAVGSDAPAVSYAKATKTGASKKQTVISRRPHTVSASNQTQQSALSTTHKGQSRGSAVKSLLDSRRKLVKRIIRAAGASAQDRTKLGMLRFSSTVNELGFMGEDVNWPTQKGSKKFVMHAPDGCVGVSVGFDNQPFPGQLMWSHDGGSAETWRRTSAYWKKCAGKKVARIYRCYFLEVGTAIPNQLEVWQDSKKHGIIKISKDTEGRLHEGEWEDVENSDYAKMAFHVPLITTLSWRPCSIVLQARGEDPPEWLGGDQEDIAVFSRAVDCIIMYWDDCEHIGSLLQLCAQHDLSVQDCQTLETIFAAFLSSDCWEPEFYDDIMSAMDVVAKVQATIVAAVPPVGSRPQKKKKTKTKAFYAVAYGSKPGIYRSHTTAFKPSSELKKTMGKYKGFDTLQEAVGHMSRFRFEADTYFIEDPLPDSTGELEPWWVVCGDDHSVPTGVFCESRYDVEVIKRLVHGKSLSYERAPSLNVAQAMYFRATKQIAKVNPAIKWHTAP